MLNSVQTIICRHLLHVYLALYLHISHVPVYWRLVVLHATYTLCLQLICGDILTLSNPFGSLIRSQSDFINGYYPLLTSHHILYARV